MYDSNPIKQHEIQSAMAALHGLGVVKAEIQFSGGNDEGGVDDQRFFDGLGNEVSVPRSDAHRREYYLNGLLVDDGWQVYQQDRHDLPWDQRYRPATEEEIRWAEVFRVLHRPIYDRYYTFAGEFYVDGTVEWNILAGSHNISGQESHQVWSDID